jgi:hypothetical protein
MLTALTAIKKIFENFQPFRGWKDEYTKLSLMKETESIDHEISYDLEKVMNSWKSCVDEWTIDEIQEEICSYNAISLQSDWSRIQTVQHLSR